MKGYQKLILAGLVVLAVAAIAALVLTGGSNTAVKIRRGRGRVAVHQPVVDQRPLETAQALAGLAATRDEEKLARDALRVADDDVDAAFAMALRTASDQPSPQTEETRAARERIQQIEADIKSDEDRVKQLTAQAARAKASDQEDLGEQLRLAQAELALDQDALGDAKEDLVRAGGDPYSRIQRMWNEHEAAQHANGTAGLANATQSAFSPGSLIAKWRRWSALRTAQAQLLAAGEDALNASATLTRDHQTLEQHVKGEQAHRQAPPQHAASLKPGEAKGVVSRTKDAAAALALMQHLSVDEKNLAALDKRIQDLQDLSATYTQWQGLAQTRQRAALHDIIKSALWIILAVLLAFLVDRLIDRSFARATLERKQLATLRGVVRFGVEALAVLVILLVVLGTPGNMSTVLGLAGAGLTVALKDFIVSFFGWFVLMGGNGMRVGDWVEINGVLGEVIEIGLLRTVLLETGNWTQPGHPTGRKVSFVNSFAVEGHYFNFTTSGQWLWDELQLLIPWHLDPYPLLEKLSEIVEKETERNVQVAEQEWQGVTRRYGMRPLTATPFVNVKSTEEGVVVIVRYITRATERSEVRARLSHAAVKLIHGETAAAPETETTPPRSGASRGEVISPDPTPDP